MYLVRVSSQDLIDAERITGIKTFIEGEIEVFYNDGHSFHVEEEYRKQFMNHISELNDNKALNIDEYIKYWNDFLK